MLYKSELSADRLWAISLIWIPSSTNSITKASFKPVHTTLEEFVNGGHFGFVFKKPRAEKSRDYCDAIVFEKLRFQILFRPYENAKPAVSYAQ